MSTDRHPPADKLAAEIARLSAKPRTNQSRLRLLQDLQVHQEEIRAQNDKLVAALHALEEARDRYVELYDFAPTGYVTLNSQGLIIEMNLTASALLGKPRDEIIGYPFFRFVAPSHRPPYLTFLRESRDTAFGPPPTVELVLRNEPITIALNCSRRKVANSAQIELLISLIDVSERKRLEAEREEARQRHADLVRQMISVQEDERRRVARDIHDDVGQQITALRLKLDLLEAAAPPRAELRNRITEVKAAADQLDARVEFLVRELRPAGLEDLGLMATLRHAVEEWSGTFGVPADFQTAGLEHERAPAEIETHVFRVAQEALTNIHKHAKARHVGVILERRRGHLVLIVEDDGTGMSNGATRSGNAGGGFGMIGMRERAALIGGTLDIESTRGSGTTVFLSVPLEAASTPPPGLRIRNP